MPEREDDHEALAAGLDIDIGRRIKLRRIQLGLSQSDLARKIGPVGVPSPSNKCRNTRTAPTACRQAGCI